VTDDDRAFWLTTFTDFDLANIASAVFQQPIPEATFSERRAVLVASGRIPDATAL
jgi:hypothetical protein